MSNGQKIIYIKEPEAETKGDAGECSLELGYGVEASKSKQRSWWAERKVVTFSNRRTHHHRAF